MNGKITKKTQIGHSIGGVIHFLVLSEGPTLTWRDTKSAIFFTCKSWSLVEGRFPLRNAVGVRRLLCPKTGDPRDRSSFAENSFRAWDSSRSSWSRGLLCQKGRERISPDSSWKRIRSLIGWRMSRQRRPRRESPVVWGESACRWTRSLPGFLWWILVRRTVLFWARTSWVFLEWGVILGSAVFPFLLQYPCMSSASTVCAPGARSRVPRVAEESRAKSLRRDYLVEEERNLRKKNLKGYDGDQVWVW